MLEQYQSQIAAALRPAFDRDSAHPDTTEVASDVLVSFLRFNVSSDPVIFRRLTSLLTSTLPGIARTLALQKEWPALLRGLPQTRGFSSLFIDLLFDHTRDPLCQF